jgi:hypothetical protein
MTRDEARIILERHLKRNYLAWELARAIEIVLTPKIF